jgi:SAM-dependent methyltransferase
MEATMQAWYGAVLRPDLLTDAPGLRGYVAADGMLVHEEIHRQHRIDPLWHDSVFQGRADNPFSTTGAETRLVRTRLHAIVRRYGIPRDTVVLDAGCADGRMTHLLLDLGFSRIIASDLDPNAVRRLVASVPADRRARVLGLADDCHRLPLEPGSVDFIVAWGLFTATPDFTKSLHATLRLLRPGGLMVSAEPLLEHALLYALVRGDVGEFLEVARTSTRARMWDQRDRRYRVYGLAEVERMMAVPGLTLLERDGVSVFPSLLYGGLLQDDRADEALKRELHETIEAVDRAGGRAYRQVMYVARKDRDGDARASGAR